MSFSSGTRIGSYEVLSAIGKGGMGEVYRARDTRLDRDVAIKTLPQEFAADPERLARFEREAKLLASLNHPNIAAIYGLERFEGRHFLVLELVEGETLADHIARGPIPVDESLRLAVQIAEALQAAHEKSVIHRDLKPANIKLTHDGAVKVLDFGLAKAMELESSAGDALSNSPTMRTMASTPGLILGTAAYMSPEQAKGRPVDRRSDIFAFGCVFYEMLTGKRAFTGEDVSDTLAAVLRAEPDWNALPKELSPPVRTMLQSCLDKDRRERMADISTALFLIRRLPELSKAQAQAAAPEQVRWKRAVPFVALVAGVAGLVIGIALTRLRSSPQPTLTRFSIALGEGQRFTNTGRHVLAISRDGTQVVYVANNQLYLRSMSDTEARPIAGTQFSTGVLTPVFSPDGSSVAFMTSSVIKRVALTGGTAITICDIRAGIFGMSWDADSILVGTGDQGIKRCSANGGPAEQLISVKDGESAESPQMLAGGRAVLYTLATENGEDRSDRSKIVVERIGSGERKVVIDGADARYLPTGHLIYAREGVLYAAPFDSERFEIGPSAPTVEGVRRALSATRTAQFMISDTGTLIYVPGPVSTTASSRALILVDRKGNAERLMLPSAPYAFPRVAPDGKHAAVGTDDGKEAAVWVVDMTSGSPPRRLTLSGGKNRFPIWNKEGDRVAFQSDREGDLGIWWQREDGSGMAERLTKAEPDEAHIPNSWSRADHDTFLFTISKADKYSVWAYSLKDKKATPVGIESDSAPDADFSPDGRWVAYSTAEKMATGAHNRHIILQPFPSTRELYEVARSRYVAWSADGKELFVYGIAAFNAIEISLTPKVTFGSPVVFPIVQFVAGGETVPRNWDPSRVDNRVLGVVDEAPPPQIRVVLNWFTELRQRVPVK
jgi:serine/threonine-protein kinase